MNNYKKDEYHSKEKHREIKLIHSLFVQIDHLQQEILNSQERIPSPRQALLRVYEMLSDEQKIAFLLAGGIEQFLRYQQQQKKQKRNITSDLGTGSLPILC